VEVTGVDLNGAEFTGGTDLGDVGLASNTELGDAARSWAMACRG
jgi:hypothetical protein